MNRRRWKKESNGIKPLIGLPTTAKEFHTDGKILIIAPHADDELIGCHQLISNHKNQVTIFYCAYMGTNSDDSNRLKRESEFRDYMHFMSVDSIISSPERVSDDLKAALLELKPTSVFIPSFVDWHPEHRLVNIKLCSLLHEYSWKLKICWFHITIPIPQEYINSFTVMDDSIHRDKWRIMKTIYISQLHIDINRFRFIESLHGEDDYYSETYLQMTIPEWEGAIKNLSCESEKLDIMKDSLGRIDLMYQQSKELYQLAFRN